MDFPISAVTNIINRMILLSVGLATSMSCQNAPQTPSTLEMEHSTTDTTASLFNSTDSKQLAQSSASTSLTMNNPAMLTGAAGADIGRLFNAYYRTGQTEKMMLYLDSNTKQRFKHPKLLTLLSDLQYGYDMDFQGMKKAGNYYLLNYVCLIAQTKEVKQLRVVIENDTARIVPNSLEKKQVFIN